MTGPPSTIRSSATGAARALLGRVRRLGQALRRLADRLTRPVPAAAFWAPVWIPLVLWAQFALLGLRPALAEHQRLDREEARLDPVLAEERMENEDLQATLRAWEDPVYRERWRRQLRNAPR
jgi:hypothetical protein